MRLFFILLLGVASCGPARVITVPVETVREVREVVHSRDSIFLRDSIREFVKGDTVKIETFRYLYRDKIIRDTVTRVDSIPRVVEVEVPGPVTNELTSLQSFQVWCGRIALGVLLLYFGIGYLRRKVGL
jgi:hypothetical protein